MPLLNHRQLPAHRRRSWEGFHAHWASWMVHDRNVNRLSERYHAEPLTQAGAGQQAYVYTFEHENEAHGTASRNGESVVATAVWAPPAPPLVAKVDFGTLDIYEVRIYDDEATRVLVAAIELVSPANKDRPSHRQAFATKCAAYLQQGVSVVIVDIIQECRGILHEALVNRLGLDDALPAFSADLYAVAYRTAGVGTEM